MQLLGYVHIDTSTSPESGFQFTARTSFTRTSQRSWSLVQGQLNACHRQSPEKSNRENALRKSNNIPLNR